MHLYENQGDVRDGKKHLNAVPLSKTESFEHDLPEWIWLSLATDITNLKIHITFHFYIIIYYYIIITILLYIIMNFHCITSISIINDEEIF